MCDFRQLTNLVIINSLKDANMIKEYGIGDHNSDQLLRIYLVLELRALVAQALRTSPTNRAQMMNIAIVILRILLFFEPRLIHWH